MAGSGGIAVAVALELTVLFLFYVAVQVFYQQVVVQFLPSGHSVVSRLVGEVGEVGDGQFRVLCIEGQGLVVGVVDLLLVAALQLVLHGLDVANDAVVEQVLEVCQTVEDPEGSVVAIGQHVAVAHAVFYRHLADGAVERRVDCRVGVVDAEPDDASDGVGQPRTALGDEGESCLHHLDAALVEVGFSIVLPIERVEAEGRAEGTCAGVEGLVVFSSLEVVALEGHHVAEADLVLGLDIQGHAVGEVLSSDVVQILVHAVAYLVEHGPHAEVAHACGAEVDGGIGGAEVEVLVLAGEVAFAAGEVDDVMFVDDLNVFVVQFLPVFVGDGGLAVAQGKGGDACGVGVAAHIAVGDTDGHPNGAFLRALGHHLHIPHLIGVADGERLAIAAIAVFFHQIGHDLDGVTGRGAALEGDKHEATVVDDAVGVHQFFAAAEGGLAEGHLVLVDIAHHLVGVWRLRHAATWGIGAAVVAHAHTACRPVGGRCEVELAIADVRVGAVADEIGAVDAGAFGDEEVGAGLCRAEGGQQGDEDEVLDRFHDVVFFWGKGMNIFVYLCAKYSSMQSTIPLAERLRPTTLDDYIGQKHIIGENAVLRRAIESGRVPSMIFWGPPGVGKTTLAYIISKQVKRQFFQLSAVSSGVKEVREVIDRARMAPEAPILFIDEIHRFSKSQQDSLLGAVEKGLVTLIGATTENPSFEVISPLLSRCQVYVLKSLEKEDLEILLDKAVKALEYDFGKKITVKEPEALMKISGGDGRKLLNAIELVVTSLNDLDMAAEELVITNDFTTDCIQSNLVKYDKQGEMHYDIISAFIKSMRGSDPNAALYYLARMIEAGEDPLFIARRMLILASEDIGNANPNALLLANACFDAVNKIGWPESRIILSQTVTYLAASPKSNAAVAAIDAAQALVRETGDLPVPLHLRNAPTKLMKDLGYHDGYKYAHAFAGNFVEQEFLPDEISGTVLYMPQDNPRERELRKSLREKWKEKYGY